MSSDAKTLLKELGRLPLSKSLGTALIIAQNSGNSDFACWCELELGGYLRSNVCMTRDTVVPVYRSVAGYYTDVRGQRIELSSGEHFAVLQLPNGVEELEILRTHRGMVTIQDPQICNLAYEQFRAEVHAYRFNTLQLTGIFSAVRVELWTNLSKLVPVEASEHLSTSGEEDLEPLGIPEWFGGNFRALWGRRKGTSKA